MQTFQSLEQVQQARLPPHIKKTVRQSLQALMDAYGPEYDPEDDGWVVLVDRTTTDQHALELFGVPWPEVRLEGVSFDQEARCFLTCHLSNNQFGITIIVPDMPWLNPEFRAQLMLEMI